MTRINVVPVTELCDQHLLAEWRELPRMANFARNCKDMVWPEDYVLGAGHMKFFLDKGVFLERRHAQLTEELLRRGFNLKLLDRFVMPQKFGYDDYFPTERALALNRARIAERMPQVPRFSD